MRKKKLIYSIILGLTLTSITACSPKKENSNIGTPETEQTSEVDENETSKDNIMEEFNKLISGEARLKEIAAFMNENLKNTTQEEASTMIVGFEELQIKRKTTQEEKYLSEEIQKGFNTLGTEGVDISQPDSIKDETIKKLLVESKEDGFKIETAEGFYFPVIDYSFYKQFSSYATSDMKDYIDIMAIESDNIFAKDAVLIISWEEVISRTLSYEKFLGQYPESKKAQDMKVLYERYEFITMHGLNNTPLFDYESKTMDEKAKDAFALALAQSIDSKYLKKLGEFMGIVEKSDYKLTDEVESYRKANTNNGSNDSNEVSKDPNRYDAAGIEEADEFDETYEILRTALSNNDKDTFADYISYPIKVNMDGKKVEIKDKNEFIKNFDKIINEDLKNIFLNQKVEEFFVNQYGIMVGKGQFWISQIAGSKHKFSIYGINN